MSTQKSIRAWMRAQGAQIGARAIQKTADPPPVSQERLRQFVYDAKKPRCALHSADCRGKKFIVYIPEIGAVCVCAAHRAEIKKYL